MTVVPVQPQTCTVVMFNSRLGDRGVASLTTIGYPEYVPPISLVHNLPFSKFHESPTIRFWGYSVNRQTTQAKTLPPPTCGEGNCVCDLTYYRKLWLK